MELMIEIPCHEIQWESGSYYDGNPVFVGGHPDVILRIWEWEVDSRDTNRDRKERGSVCAGGGVMEPKEICVACKGRWQNVKDVLRVLKPDFGPLCEVCYAVQTDRTGDLEVTCPWCGCEWSDSWEAGGDPGEIDVNDELCDECGHRFSWSRCISVTYSSQRIFPEVE